MKREIIIKPQNGLFNLDLREIWQYRELFYILIWRNLKVKYKQTFLGVAWVLFQPLVTTVVFSIFFGKIAKIPSGNLPYPLFSYIGLIIWNFFSGALSSASGSIVSMGGMIQKVYFPRIIIPLSTILTSAVDFGISFVPLVFLLFYFHIVPSIVLLPLIPIFFLIVFLAVAGLSFFTSSLNVRYRDVGFILPFFIQIGLFVTPVIYSIDIIYDYRKWFLIVNPLTGVIENFRILVGGSNSVNIPLLLVSFLVSGSVFLFGLYYFKRTERLFADIV